MLVSGVFVIGGLIALILAAYTKFADIDTFGHINNLLTLAVALFLLAIFVLLWEITQRVISRSDE